MRMRISLLFVVSLCVAATVFARSNDDGANARFERLNAILAETLAEVPDLRLPENRASFYSRIGNLVWLQDEKRARTLFRNAAAELVAAQNLAESKRAANPHSDLLMGGSVRQQILHTIANRDAELALELLVATRPAMIQRALEAPKDSTRKISNFTQNYGYLAQNERQMEQNFYRMAADQNPDRAAKLLKESLSKGLTSDTFNQLERLSQRDPGAAEEMSAQIVDKLIRSTYITEEQPNYIDIQLTNTILSYHISRRSDDTRKLKFDDAQIQSLAAKIVNAYVADQRIAGAIGQSIMPIAEKLRPSSVESIKKLNARMNPQNGGSETDAAYQKLMSAETPVEVMLAAADKFPTSHRRQIYQNASNRLMGAGDWQAARQIIVDNFASEDGSQELVNFDQQLAYNLIGQGKFAEAESVIDGMPPQHRISLLVNMAISIFHLDQNENRAHAATVLAKARQMVNEKPENSQEMGMLMSLVGAYAQIDPAEAMRIFESAIPKLTELTDAAAIINGFQVNSNVRDGEFLVMHGLPTDQFGGNSYMFASFAKGDLERTLTVIDSFKRPEIRLMLRLQLLDGSELTSRPVSRPQASPVPVLTRVNR